MIAYALSLIFGYLAGSFPTGYLLVRQMTGEDIRTLGSGNIGATNVGRVLGKKWAIFTAVFDMFKGGGAIVIAYILSVGSPICLSLIGVGAVLGHDFPAWLGFKGGKGVATTFGVIAFFDLFDPIPAIVGGLLWFLLREMWAYVSVASIAGLVAAAAMMLLLGADTAYCVASVCLAALAAVRHKENIRRLIAGTENKVDLIIPKIISRLTRNK